MKITIINSSEDHPVNEWLKKWISLYKDKHDISLVRKKSELIGGDLLFLISCSEIIDQHHRNRFLKVLVIHASDLPLGRGWSPHIWSILSGETKLIVSLLEAEDKVDSGKIWKKETIHIPKTALYYEINDILFAEEMKLMTYAVENFYSIIPSNQDISVNPTYYPKRTPKDSELDTNKTIDEQFDLIRVCDPERYPAFFYKYGQKFIIKIEKIHE